MILAGASPFHALKHYLPATLDRHPCSHPIRLPHKVYSLDTFDRYPSLKTRYLISPKRRTQDSPARPKSTAEQSDPKWCNNLDAQVIPKTTRNTAIDPITPTKHSPEKAEAWQPPSLQQEQEFDSAEPPSLPSPSLSHDKNR